MSPEVTDVIIVGAGPIGLACGIEAKKRGLKHLIIEAGCLVNSLYNYPVYMTFFSTSDRLEIGNVPFISHGFKPNRNEALEYYRRVKKHWELNVNTYETVTGIEKKEGLYEIVTEKKTYLAHNAVIATGFYGKPNLMNVPGENLPKVMHYYKEPHPFADHKVIVVGGGNSSVDAALETFRKGADVTMVIMTGNLDPGVKYWVRPDIENRIREGEIKAYFNTVIKAIREKEVDLCGPGGDLTLENDFVLAMTGYKPDYELLAKAGVKITEDKEFMPVHDPVTFETNMKGLFLAGCVCGGMNTSKWNIESARFHAVNIMDCISGILRGEKQ